MNQIIDNIYQKSKSNIKKIILVEPEDDRIVQAVKLANQQKIADVTLLDTKPQHHPLFNNLVEQFYQLRKNKGISLKQSQEILQNPLYFGTMLVQSGNFDGMVAGANNTTQETFRPALQIIKTKPGEQIASSFFIMETPNQDLGHQGIFIFSDCGLNIDPNSEQLAQIAIQSYHSFKQLIGSDPKMAMLSYSTNNSSSGPSVDKVKQATDIVRQQISNVIIDGEIQSDAAIIPSVAQKKYPQSQLQGQANILIFPDLNSGNIAYKLVERIGNTHAYGPLLQGINKPINDLSRGCSIEDIITTIAITSVQSQLNANW